MPRHNGRLIRHTPLALSGAAVLNCRRRRRSPPRAPAVPFPVATPPIAAVAANWIPRTARRNEADRMLKLLKTKTFWGGLAFDRNRRRPHLRRRRRRRPKRHRNRPLRHPDPRRSAKNRRHPVAEPPSEIEIIAHCDRPNLKPSPLSLRLFPPRPALNHVPTTRRQDLPHATPNPAPAQRTSAIGSKPHGHAQQQLVARLVRRKPRRMADLRPRPRLRLGDDPFCTLQWPCRAAAYGVRTEPIEIQSDTPTMDAWLPWLRVLFADRQPPRPGQNLPVLQRRRLPGNQYLQRRRRQLHRRL